MFVLTLFFLWKEDFVNILNYFLKNSLPSTYALCKGMETILLGQENKTMYLKDTWNIYYIHNIVSTKI